ncbi:hypothetical protein F4818DRAFT_453923 [Hypoxylon cercidicola]|nr:hypothetical protein F4818DRAFT_453923 [Hypoxylon cercidicola]
MAAVLDITTLRRILSQSKPLVPWAGDPRSHALAAIEITKSADVNHLIKWNDDMIVPTLRFAKEHLRIGDGVHIRTKIAAPDKSAIARIRNGPLSLMVDHLIMLDDWPKQNLVVGLGRPSLKFQGRMLADRLGNTSKEALWPLRQLANVGDITKTRYGYIQTNEDLTVCCFSREAPDHWKAAVMPIPWSRHGENQLTTDLALWWLSMLAMSGPENRAIVKEVEMTRINQWDPPSLDEECGWVRQHKYSKFVEPTNPPPPPAF